MHGKLIIISAPSGAGKTTLVKHLLDTNPDLVFSVSACSREKRPHEKEGKDYYFISAEEFKNKIRNDEFVEWEEVYKDHFYGTLKSEIERILSGGKSVVFDVDVIGGLNIKKQYGNMALAIFVMPPSVEELQKRLVKRSTESDKEMKNRIAKAGAEMEYVSEFDRIIVNDDLNKAKQEVRDTVKEFLMAGNNTKTI